MNDTKQKILSEALNLFSKNGYNAVSVYDIAYKVGIKAPSIYKHYKSKRDIFNAILSLIEEKYQAVFSAEAVDSQPSSVDYGRLGVDGLTKLTTDLFHFYLHDEFVCKFRRLILLESTADAEISKLFLHNHIDAPLQNAEAILSDMMEKGLIRKGDAKSLALQFYAPIHLLLLGCDADYSREKASILLIKRHVAQFIESYGIN